ncbi:MAG: hypothetical protein E7638_00155 [Ruminococcaceae bacterium]|nr:hypothetical protein [Oscillospiraceae bacterium]
MGERNMHKDHRGRLRRLYENEGLSSFEPHVILELLLFDSIPRIDTNPIGHALIDRFGSLAGVLAADEKELCEVRGIGKVSAEMICSVRDHMLFRMLAECDFSSENDVLDLAAEYHMRRLSDGDMVLLSEAAVWDYTSCDGSWEGVGEGLLETLDEEEVESYAVVFRSDDGSVPGELMSELASAEIPYVFVLTGGHAVKTATAEQTERTEQ